MTDHDRTELASALLDGETTPDERARVEDDPTIGGEVERLRTVRAMVADVPEQRVSVREQHLATALEAWERVPAERDATPRSISAGRRRPRQTSVNRWTLAAAAGLVIVLAGGLIVRNITDRDDTDDITAEVDADATATAEVAVADTGTNDEADAEVSEDESLALSDAVELAEESDAPPSTPDPDTADLDTDPAAADAAAAPPPEDDLVVLESASELASFAADALAVDGDIAAANEDAIQGEGSGGALPENARTIPPSDEESLGTAELPDCPGADVVVGPAIYDGDEVVVAVDSTRRWALAFAVEDCQPVARARLGAVD